ncbi:MAG: HAMP domain-containing protein [Nitrospinae bacterium]|nr:HAMP domain-containing protein [Nitrospinota bacterium]
MIKSIRRLFRRLSIRYKVPLVIMSLATATLLIIFIAMVVNEWFVMKENIEGNIEAQTRIIGANSAAALVFDDTKAAAETLSSLSASPHIASAILYDKKGKPFARYLRNNAEKSLLPYEPVKERYYYKGNHLIASQDISFDNKSIGSISVTTDLDDFYSSLKRYIAYITVIMIFALAGVILLSFLLQRLITRPIVQLNNLMSLISREKNYSHRAVKYTDDEIGALVDGFNNMLSIIQIHQTEMIKSGQLASIGELAAGIAHEINNPINGIINYAQIIANKSENASRENDIANRIIKEGNRIASIVSSLLSFSHQDKEEKAVVPVHEILSDSLELTERQLLKDNIILKTDVSPQLTEVIANSQQVQQVFMNLISNARYALNSKYTEKHTDKIFEIYGEEVIIDNYPYIKVTFHDRGIGIPADIKDKIIEPFFTTKPRGEGTGLGLSISHGIISDHGGKITIESREVEFTKVAVVLPAKKRTKT